jgi:hypothetical protein
VAWAAVALAACAPVRPALEGRVIDAASGQPLAGATVRLDVAVACDVGGTVRRDPQPRRYAETDAEGRFAFGGDPVEAGCRFPELWGELRARAPGYAAARETGVFEDPGRRAGVVALRPEGDRAGVGERGPAVFAVVAGAALDRVALTREGHLVARDRLTGRLHAWSPAGAAIAYPVPDAVELLGGYQRHEREFPLVGLGGLVFAVDDPTRWLELRPAAGAVRAAVESHGQLVTLESDGRAVGTYDTRAVGLPLRTVGVPAGDVRPAAEAVGLAGARAECLAALPGPGRRPVLVVATPDGARRAFGLTSGGRAGPPAWAALPLGPGALAGDVTACAGGRHALYVATAVGEILKVERPRGLAADEPWEATRRARAPAGARPAAVVALAVSAAPLRPDAVYAVTGGEVVYRFDEDLVPG